MWISKSWNYSSSLFWCIQSYLCLICRRFYLFDESSAKCQTARKLTLGKEVSHTRWCLPGLLAYFEIIFFWRRNRLFLFFPFFDYRFLHPSHHASSPHFYYIILLKDSRDKMEKRETGYLGVQSSVSTIKYLNLTGSRGAEITKLTLLRIKCPSSINLWLRRPLLLLPLSLS